jgi:hypothetical protein
VGQFESPLGALSDIESKSSTQLRGGCKRAI